MASWHGRRVSDPEMRVESDRFCKFKNPKKLATEFLSCRNEIPPFCFFGMCVCMYNPTYACIYVYRCTYSGYAQVHISKHPNRPYPRSTRKRMEKKHEGCFWLNLTTQGCGCIQKTGPKSLKIPVTCHLDIVNPRCAEKNN